MKKKIAFLVYDMSLTGGAEVITGQLAEDLADRYEILVISLFQENKEALWSAPGCEHLVVSPKTKSISTHILSLSRAVKSMLKQREIQILFAVTAGVNGVSWLATRKTRTKFVYVEHSNLMNQTYGKKHFLRQKIGARYANRIVTLTERDKENYKKILNVQSDRLTVIPNWFEVQGQAAAYNSSSKRIMTVGRLAKIKGYDTLLDVAKTVLQQHPDWSWDIYGDGPERETIQQAILEKGLGKKVFLKGNVTNLAVLYHQYAMFVLCSHYEGIPLVFLEAQSWMLPIVSFDCQTGPREIISNGVNGCLIREREEQEMAHAICYLIENPDIRESYAAHAGDSLDQFEKEGICERWVQLIEELC